MKRPPRRSTSYDGPATALFVRGGWHHGWSWHLVRELLDSDGVPSVVLDLPTRTLGEDAAVLRAALDDTEGPAVVCHARGQQRRDARRGRRAQRGAPYLFDDKFVTDVTFLPELSQQRDRTLALIDQRQQAFQAPT
jgi:hypothetical protein